MIFDEREVEIYPRDDRTVSFPNDASELCKKRRRRRGSLLLCKRRILSRKQTVCFEHDHLRLLIFEYILYILDDHLRAVVRPSRNCRGYPRFIVEIDGRHAPVHIAVAGENDVERISGFTSVRGGDPRFHPVLAGGRTDCEAPCQKDEYQRERHHEYQ